MIKIFALALLATPLFVFLALRVRTFLVSGRVSMRGFDCLRRESPLDYWTGMAFALFGMIFAGCVSLVTLLLSAAYLLGLVDAPN